MSKNSCAGQLLNSNYVVNSKKVNPHGYKPHPLLEKFGVRYETNQALLAVYKRFSMLAEKPIVTPDKEVITHMDDINAALASDTDISVYEIDIPLDEIPLLINLKYSRSRATLSGEYEKIKYLEEVIKSVKGKELFKDVPGDTRAKIAAIMGTSDSTVKRIMYIGKNKPTEFGLIEQSEKSMKQVEYEIQQEQRQSNKKNRGVCRKTLTKSDINSNGSVELTTGQLSIAGIGDFSISTNSGTPTIVKDGVELKGYLCQSTVVNKDGQPSNATFLFATHDQSKMRIDLIIYNYDKI